MLQILFDNYNITTDKFEIIDHGDEVVRLR